MDDQEGAEESTQSGGAGASSGSEPAARDERTTEAECVESLLRMLRGESLDDVAAANLCARVAEALRNRSHGGVDPLEEAKEVLGTLLLGQEAALTKGHATMQPPRNLTAFIRKAHLNMHRMRRRTALRHVAALKRKALRDGPAVSDPPELEVVDPAESTRRCRALADALREERDSVPATARAVARLWIGEGMRPGEVRTELGLNEAQWRSAREAVKRGVSRALDRAQLRCELFGTAEWATLRNGLRVW